MEKNSEKPQGKIIHLLRVYSKPRRNTPKKIQNCLTLRVTLLTIFRLFVSTWKLFGFGGRVSLTDGSFFVSAAPGLRNTKYQSINLNTTPANPRSWLILSTGLWQLAAAFSFKMRELIACLHKSFTFFKQFNESHAPGKGGTRTSFYLFPFKSFHDTEHKLVMHTQASCFFWFENSPFIDHNQAQVARSKVSAYQG